MKIALSRNKSKLSKEAVELIERSVAAATLNLACCEEHHRSFERSTKYDIAVEALGGSTQAADLLVGEANHRGVEPLELAQVIVDKRRQDQKAIAELGVVRLKLLDQANKVTCGLELDELSAEVVRLLHPSLKVG